MGFYARILLKIKTAFFSTLTWQGSL